MIGWFRRRRQERDLRVLAAVRAEPDGTYGLGLMRSLKLRPGHLYPALDRLVDAGLVSVREEADPGNRPPRQLYFAVEE